MEQDAANMGWVLKREVESFPPPYKGAEEGAQEGSLLYRTEIWQLQSCGEFSQQREAWHLSTPRGAGCCGAKETRFVEVPSVSELGNAWAFKSR